MSYHGRVEKTMEAESVGLLSHLIQTALDRVREENKFDIVMFLGIDGRIFCSSIPNLLDSAQYQLLSWSRRTSPTSVRSWRPRTSC